jgi:hypothetical protein
MHLVAIMDAPAGARDDAESLARALGGGITALDVRMALSAVLPAVLLRTPSRERAEQAARVLVAAGLGAVAMDLADAVPVERMVHVHRPAFEDAGMRADTQGPMLPYVDIGAIVRVMAETSIWRTTREKEISGVQRHRPVVQVEHTRIEHTVENVVFLFVRGAGVPWVLRAGEARYLALGAELRRTATENFFAVVALLRRRAPLAVYDERFVAHPLVRQAETHVRNNDHAAAELGDAGVEARVHLLARLLGCGPTP